MDVGLLYSGGTDSTLAALFLDPLADVILLGGSFGITDDAEHARDVFPEHTQSRVIGRVE